MPEHCSSASISGLLARLRELHKIEDELLKAIERCDLEARKKVADLYGQKAGIPDNANYDE